MDYGQFGLVGDPEDSEFAQDALEEAQRGEGIGRRRQAVVVISPHHDNFAMPLRVEVWDGEAPDDLYEWQEVFVASMRLRYDGLIFESPTVASEQFDIEDGQYAVRICGSGFTPDSIAQLTEATDWWRIQLWRTDSQITPRRVRGWDGQSVAVRPAWADGVAASPVRSDADPWTELRALTERLEMLRWERHWDFYEHIMSGFKIIVNGRDWATFDMDVIGAVLANLIREPVPFPQWSEAQLRLLVSSFADLDAALPELLQHDPELFGMVAEVKDLTTEIVDQLLPTVEPASLAQYPAAPIDLDTASEQLAQLTELGRPKGGRSDERIEVFSDLGLSDLTRAWRDLDGWLGPIVAASRRSDGRPTYLTAVHLGHQVQHLVTESPPRSPTHLMYRWNWVPNTAGPKQLRPLLSEEVGVSILIAKQLDGVCRTDIYLDGTPKAWRKALLNWWHAAAPGTTAGDRPVSGT